MFIQTVLSVINFSLKLSAFTLWRESGSTSIKVLDEHYCKMCDTVFEWIWTVRLNSLHIQLHILNTTTKSKNPLTVLFSCCPSSPLQLTPCCTDQKKTAINSSQLETTNQLCLQLSPDFQTTDFVSNSVTFKQWAETCVRSLCTAETREPFSAHLLVNAHLQTIEGLFGFVSISKSFW